MGSCCMMQGKEILTGGSITELGPGDAVNGDGDAKKSNQRVDLFRLLPERVNEIVGRPGRQGSLGRYGHGRASPPHPGQSMILMAMLGSLEPKTRAREWRV